MSRNSISGGAGVGGGGGGGDCAFMDGALSVGTSIQARASISAFLVGRLIGT